MTVADHNPIHSGIVMHGTIRSAAEALRQRHLSCVELLDQHLARIDQHEVRIRAWVIVDRDRARQQARKADAELKSGLDRGLLHGIPIAIKDIFDVFDMPTACGSKRWQNAIARQDAPAVSRLRQAGAVIIGKTVTTAYASFDPPPTRNPWNLSRTPGGSSSGSAAAVAMGMCLGALGSQTGGSITRPASYCGVAGCKPGYGMISTQGVLPLAASMDHVGPMAGCVEDVEILLRAILDAGWRERFASFTSAPRLGRPRGFFERYADDAVRAMMDDVSGELVEKGATIVEIELPSAFEEVVARHRTIMGVESAAFHQERLARYPDDYPPNITSLLEEGIRCSAPEYARAREHQEQLRHEMSELLGRVDALLCPATTRSAPDATTTGDPAFNSPWSYTGLPVVSFPVRLGPDGMPLAVQLIGQHGQNRRLFDVARWCEREAGPGIGLPPETC